MSEVWFCFLHYLVCGLKWELSGAPLERMMSWAAEEFETLDLIALHTSL